MLYFFLLSVKSIPIPNEKKENATKTTFQERNCWGKSGGKKPDEKRNQQAFTANNTVKCITSRKYFNISYCCCFFFFQVLNEIATKPNKNSILFCHACNVLERRPNRHRVWDSGTHSKHTLRNAYFWFAKFFFLQQNHGISMCIFISAFFF